MKIRDLGTRESLGTFALIYGEPSVGKTLSTLLTLPRPILYYALDPRDVEKTVQGNMDDFTQIEIREPESFEELMTDLSEHEQEISSSFKSIVLDPISYACNVMLLGAIEQETGEAAVFDVKKRRLVNTYRSDQTGYGALASWMKRLMKVLGVYAKGGMNVICISLLTDSPKWNKELAAAPAFAGKEFNRDYPAYFDLIGLVEQRTDTNGGILYPPLVRFRSEEGTFIAKWTGKQDGKTSGPLDWSKILGVVKKGGDRTKGE